MYNIKLQVYSIFTISKGYNPLIVIIKYIPHVVYPCSLFILYRILGISSSLVPNLPPLLSISPSVTTSCFLNNFIFIFDCPGSWFPRAAFPSLQRVGDPL